MSTTDGEIKPYKDVVNDEEEGSSIGDGGDEKVDFEPMVHGEDDDEERAGLNSLVSSMEIEKAPPRRRRKEQSLSDTIRMGFAWWIDTKRYIKLLVFVSILVVVIISVDSFKYSENKSLVVVWDPNDLVSCDLRKYNETYDEFMEGIHNIQNPDDFCESDLQFGSKTCACLDPTKPVKVDHSKWDEAFEKNKELAKASLGIDPLQVVLVGDSAIEHWNGLSVGRPVKKLNGIKRIFEEVFTEKGGGKINAVALGVSGDRAPNLLYRIKNGGIGDLEPDIWWVLIGINDLVDDFCNVEAVVAANIAVVEEIMSRRPKSRVVINSLLPRTPMYWVHLSRINQRLECYAALTPRVEFFNATSIFMLPDGTLKHLPDNVHLDEEGSRIWGEKIVQEVVSLVGY